jgi:hypothetical protein
MDDNEDRVVRFHGGEVGAETDVTLVHVHPDAETFEDPATCIDRVGIVAEE